MAKYQYARHILNTVYTETFVKNLGTLGRGADTYGHSMYNLTNDGYFESEGTYNGATSTVVRYRVAENEEAISNHNSLMVRGKYLAKFVVAGFGTNADLYEAVPSYSMGNFIEIITAEEGAYPIDGHQDGYWYQRGPKATSYPLVNVNGEWKEPTNGYIRVDGVWREISESYVNILGSWKGL